MTKQHKATPDDWAQQEDWANRSVFSDSSCILELRDRIEALEAAQQPPQDKLDRLIALDRDDPAGSLVDRIATGAELCRVYNDAPEHGFGPALRAVYDLGREHGAAPTQPGPESSPAGSLVDRVQQSIYDHPCGEEARAAILEVAAALIDWWDSDEVARTGWEAAKWLEQEANR
jgi:hypothetical protein